MLGIDNELEQLFLQATHDGKAIFKEQWTPGNYGCCSTRAPQIEKYKIVFSKQQATFYLWGRLLVDVNRETNKVTTNEDYQLSNYEKKISDWFIQRSLSK